MELGEKFETLSQLKLSILSDIAIDDLINELTTAKKLGANRINIREDRDSSREKKLYGAWLNFGRILSEEEVNQQKINYHKEEIKKIQKINNIK